MENVSIPFHFPYLFGNTKKPDIREKLTPSSSRHGEYSEGIVAFDLDSENSVGMKPGRGPPVFGKGRPAEAGVPGEVRATSPGESSVAHAATPCNTACSFPSLQQGFSLASHSLTITSFDSKFCCINYNTSSRLLSKIT